MSNDATETVLITGASGNMGSMLRARMANPHHQRDRNSRWHR